MGVSFRGAVLRDIRALMVIDDFNAVWVSGRPHEADPPLVVDANTVLPQSIALQCLQPVATNGRKILKRDRRVQASEPGSRRELECSKSFDAVTVEKLPGIFAAERRYQIPIVI